MDGLWPYFVVLIAGFLPNEVFRVAGVLLSRGVDETSEVFLWIRVTATTLLAGVVSRLLYSPGGSLDAVPVAFRFAAVAIGALAFFAFRRSLLLGVVIGELFLVGAAWWFGVG